MNRELGELKVKNVKMPLTRAIKSVLCPICIRDYRVD